MREYCSRHAPRDEPGLITRSVMATKCAGGVLAAKRDPARSRHAPRDEPPDVYGAAVRMQIAEQPNYFPTETRHDAMHAVAD